MINWSETKIIVYENDKYGTLYSHESEIQTDNFTFRLLWSQFDDPSHHEQGESYILWGYTSDIDEAIDGDIKMGKYETFEQVKIAGENFIASIYREIGGIVEKAEAA